MRNPDPVHMELSEDQAAGEGPVLDAMEQLREQVDIESLRLELQASHQRESALQATIDHGNKELSELQRQFQEFKRLMTPAVPAPATVSATHLAQPSPAAPTKGADILDRAYAYRKATKWPEWDGKAESFPTHAFLLRVKIEEDKPMLGSDRNICLEMFNSLPKEKQPRVDFWFREGGPERNYNWEKFLKHFEDQFEDKQAAQVAGDKLSRMRMGSAQTFESYLQDFELKLAQCGGRDWPSRSKVLHLDAGLNEKLKAELVPKSLDSDNYDKWVQKVRGVAGRLENLPNYKPKGTVQTRTWYLSKGGSAAQTVHEPPAKPTTVPATDHEGDTVMSGINSLKAQILALQEGFQRKPRARKRRGSGSKNLPPATWRSSDEVTRLISERKCIRCRQTGHIGLKCPSYGPAVRPSVNHVAEGNSGSEGASEEEHSENE